MTDYKKSTGNSGTMMIRDNGSTVSFMINSNNSSTFAHQLPWGYTVNGTTNNSRESDYGAGDGWVTLGSWTVSTDQTVTFRLFDTGTSGFGGPTTFSVSIDRASAPATPTINSITEVTGTSMRVKWTAGSNNGASIDTYQVAHNTSNTTSGSTINNVDTDTVFTGLKNGTTYYWWARTHNAKGYSGWSGVKSATTLRVPDAPNTPIISDITQTTFVVSFTDGASNGGSAILERQITFNTIDTGFSGADLRSVTYNGVMTVTGLQPATTYYVWARVRNSVGWSSYSRAQAGYSFRTIAGAKLNVNGVWKDAIPYVNVGGTWKLARPWGRDAGVWKEST